MHPPFVTAQSLMERHALTPADRRKTFDHLRGTVRCRDDSDYHDQNTFFRMLLELYGRGPDSYRKFTAELIAGNKGGQRSLHVQCLEEVRRRLSPSARSRLRNDLAPNESHILRSFFQHVHGDEDVDAVAWFLWADWLRAGKWGLAETTLKANSHLAERFAGWRPAADQTPSEHSPMDYAEHLLNEGHQAIDDGDVLNAAFAKLFSQLEEASRTRSSDSLYELAHDARSLAEQIDAKQEAAICHISFQLHAIAAASEEMAYPRLNQAGAQLLLRLDQPASRALVMQENIVHLQSLWSKVQESYQRFPAAKAASDADLWDELLKDDADRAWRECKEAMEVLAGELDEISARLAQTAEIIQASDQDDSPASADAEQDTIAARLPVDDDEKHGPTDKPAEAPQADDPGQGEAPIDRASTHDVSPLPPDTQPAVPEQPGESEPAPAVITGDSLELAASFLRREEIGSFELVCQAAERLRYVAPPREIAQLIGSVAREDYLGQQRFRDALAGWTERATKGLPTPVERGSVLLIFACLILPAITNPTTRARDALRALDLAGVPDECHRLRVAILGLGQAYPSLSAMCTPLDDEDAVANLRKACEDYYGYVQIARKRKLSYQPATVVWESLLRDIAISGIGPQEVTQPTVLKSKVQKALELLDEPDTLIDRVDEEKRNHQTKRKRIVAGARQSLLNGIAELVDHLAAVKRWVELTEIRTAAVHHAEDKRRGDVFRTLCKASATSLRAAGIDPDKNGFASVAREIAVSLIDAQAEALGTGKFQNPFADSLRYDRYRLSWEARRPEESPDTVWHALTKSVLDPRRSWLEVFDNAIAQDDHIGSGAVLPLAQELDGSRDLQAERLAAIERARRELEKERMDTLQNLVRAMNYAPAGDTELDALRVEVEALDPSALPLDNTYGESAEPSLPAANSISDFSAARSRLSVAQHAVDAVERNAIAEARERIVRLKTNQPAETIAYLEDLVKRPDLITLMEELPLIERGQPIVLDTSRSNPLLAFAAAMTQAEQSGIDAGNRLRALATRADAAEMRAINLARAWGHLIDVRRGDPARLVGDLLTQIGFVVLGEGEHIGAPTRFFRTLLLRTRRIADRETCAVARFGSEASGRYHVVLAEKDAKPAEIVEAIPSSPATATLLLLKNSLGVQDRVELARLARQKDRAFCLVDTELILFLAGRANPLADFFACSIPFCSASPFALQPGSIPVEIFFGRDQEIRSVFEPDGSCIVYGGRQLGKSVMLDHIAKTQEVLGRVIARRVDCQAILNRSADVWRIIAGTLQEAGLPRLAQAPTSEHVARTIREWLKESSDRRILLMLDETNDFVLGDAESGFPQLIALRRLMEATGRRFKVVLSGQHNVLRMTHNPNTPLAHFGQPIVIGPLRGGDLRAARQLVTEPLAAVGYAFEDAGLISRILAETQYYPKLIQILCQNLLRHMRRQGLADGRHRTLPPWTIHTDDLSAVLRNNEIRKEIFSTFQITLQLDKRYELISLIFADKLYDRKTDRDSRVGFSVQELMDEAFRFWPQGFPTSNRREVFHALLDELVGLGILTEDASSGRYQLGSPIIGSMIGTAEEVEHRLLAFEAEALPPQIEPERRRMPIDSDETWPNLSPLVPAQISRLMGEAGGGPMGRSRVAIVFGTPAMRLEYVPQVLEASARLAGATTVVRKLKAHPDRSGVLREIAGIRDEPQICLIVSADTPWGPSWVRGCVESTRRCRLVFLGDAYHAWRCHVQEREGLGQATPVETLGPLSVAEIEDQLRRNASSAEATRATAERIHGTTGGFIAPFAGLWKPDLARGLDRFENGDLNSADYGVPTLPALQSAIAKLLSYITPGEEVRVSDLQSIAAETGVDGDHLSGWLVAIGLAETSTSTDRYGDGGGAICLNPILRHRSLLRNLGASG